MVLYLQTTTRLYKCLAPYPEFVSGHLTLIKAAFEPDCALVFLASTRHLPVTDLACAHTKHTQMVSRWV